MTDEQKQVALNQVLRSQTFARSEQLRNFLKFICEKEIAGQGSEINEYLIGVEVMRRPSDYSPNEDGAVRNRAYALRNKLQEFYAHEQTEACIRIELPKGAYCPRFIQCDSPPEFPPPFIAREQSPEHMVAVESETDRATVPSPVSAKRLRKFWAAVLIVIAALAVALAMYVFRPPSQSALDQFWGPVLASNKPVLICTTQPAVYQLTGQARENWQHRQAALPPGKDPSYDLPPDEILRGEDVAAITDQYVGIGTSHATAQLTALFARLHKNSFIKIGNEASFADLRHSPAVLLGAFGNRWTMGIANHLRFVFEERDVYHRFIVDKVDPRNSWGFSALPITGRVSEDFVIISRVFQSETGEILITAAGITQYGTRAAGEFLTNPIHFEMLARRAPEGWQRKNLQIVFSVKILDNTPGPPTVLATHFW